MPARPAPPGQPFGVWAAQRTPLDALPDLSDTQVTVATEWMGRNPTLSEDQVTYPIATTFLGAPNVKTVRGFTMLLPVLIDEGAGADVAKRIAAPMWGLVSLTLLTLLVTPAVYVIWRSLVLRRS